MQKTTKLACSDLPGGISIVDFTYRTRKPGRSTASESGLIRESKLGICCGSQAVTLWGGYVSFFPSRPPRARAEAFLRAQAHRFFARTDSYRGASSAGNESNHYAGKTDIYALLCVGGER